MWKSLIIIAACLQSIFALTVNHNIQLTGGWCSICGGDVGNYACSNDDGLWQNGFRTFDSLVPEGNVVTEVKMTLRGEWACFNPYATISASLQGTELGVQDVTGQCWCDNCDEDVVFTWENFGKCFPGFNYFGENQVHIDVQFGLICLSSINVEVTYIEGDLLQCGCGNLGECTYGHMRCVDDDTYETCAFDAEGVAHWGPHQYCHEGLTCEPTGDYIYCLTELSNDECTVGQMRCVDDDSYQTCALNLNGEPQWQTVQDCQVGLTCNPDPTGQTIMCVSEVFLARIPGECTPGSMRCVTENTYQMCHGTEDDGVWNPVQSCADDLYCQPSGDHIYCVAGFPEHACTYGDYRCASDNTYQVCDRDRDGATFWNVIQNCQAGLHCHQQQNVIYCY